MRIVSSTQYDESDLNDFTRVPFLMSLSYQDLEQYSLLLKQTYVLDLDVDDLLMQQGSEKKEFYAVLSGRLDVVVEENVVGHVSAGQLIGVFSLLNSSSRNATLRASGLKGARVIAINFGLFGELSDFSFFNLTCKLCLYREVEKFARWKLDSYVKISRDLAMAEAIKATPVFAGEKNSFEELKALDHQVRKFSELFTQMNKAYRT